MNLMITCPYCKKSFEIHDAIQHQIEEDCLVLKLSNLNRCGKNLISATK